MPNGGCLIADAAEFRRADRVFVPEGPREVGGAVEAAPLRDLVDGQGGGEEQLLGLAQAVGQRYSWGVQRANRLKQRIRCEVLRLHTDASLPRSISAP